ncbi:substrate-binding periplasmic protein [Pseudomonas oligotrophica]|uniref:substrate-binding periplasmic protein n=1 Tax=Pseudomonas oligotrophica TaxID=2912055 RepID=UPI003D75CBA6
MDDGQPRHDCASSAAPIVKEDRTVRRPLSLLALLLVGLSALQAQAAERLLTVGYYDFPPVMYRDEHGVTRGEMADLTRQVLRQAGYQPRFRQLPSARLYAALVDGTVDVWLGAPGKIELRSHTLESRHNVGHTQLNLYHRADTPPPRIPDSLAGQGLIILNGYSYWPRINRLLQDPALDIRLLRTASHHSALAMLLHRRADYLLDYQLPAEQVRREQGLAALPHVVLQRVPVHFIVSRHIADSEAVLDNLDRAFVELRAAGRLAALPEG